MNQEPDTVSSVLALMPSTAVEVAKFAHIIIKSVKNGDVNPLKIQVAMRALEMLAKEVVEEIKEEVLTEAEKNSEKKFNAYGSLIERCEIKTEYDYATSGDTEYERLQADFDTAKSRLDERTAVLKALKQPMLSVDTLTGEVVKIMPPQKKSKTGVKVYLSNAK
jgi:N-acetylglucosamine kinase-like BadF-type ATPase